MWQIEAALMVNFRIFGKNTKGPPTEIEKRKAKELGQEARSASTNQKAISCYYKALKLDPGDPDMWYEKGVCHQAQAKQLEKYVPSPRGAFDEAIKCFEKALEIKPDDAFVIAKLADTWREKGLTIYDRARKSLTDGSYTLPSYNPRIEALECFSRAVELNPVDKLSWFFKAIVADDLENSDYALEAYNNFLKITKETIIDVPVGEIISMDDALDIKSGVLQERIAYAKERIQKLKT